MADSIRLEIVTPEEVVVDDSVQSIMAPGSEGGFGVLPGHTTFLSTLSPGSVQYIDEGGHERYVFVSGGFAEVLPGKVTVLAESAERGGDIDGDRARAALDRARQRVAAKESGTDHARAEAAMARALGRLKVLDIRE